MCCRITILHGNCITFVLWEPVTTIFSLMCPSLFEQYALYQWATQGEINIHDGWLRSGHSKKYFLPGWGEGSPSLAWVACRLCAALQCTCCSTQHVREAAAPHQPLILSSSPVTTSSQMYFAEHNYRWSQEYRGKVMSNPLIECL